MEEYSYIIKLSEADMEHRFHACELIEDGVTTCGVHEVDVDPLGVTVLILLVFGIWIFGFIMGKTS